MLKGEDDIRLVYDLTASVLNDALWAPMFWMPSLDNVLEVATHSSWFGDIDAAEFFITARCQKFVNHMQVLTCLGHRKGNALH